MHDIIPFRHGIRTSPACRPVPESTQAPWIRPGVVVHDPAECIDGLLAEFALALRARGFKVAGYVQSNNRGCTGQSQGCAPRIDYFDLGRSTTLSIERGYATQSLADAMTANADLLVLSRFSACIEATRHFGAAVGPDASVGMPLLTSIAGQCIHKWHSFARHDGAMIAPDMRSLWRWWGPERLYRDLVCGVAEDETRRIVLGGRWIMVEGPHGVGLAPVPRQPRALFPKLARLSRQSLKSLAGLAESWDPVEAALGVAAINAHYNRPGIEGKPGNGVKRLRPISPDVVVIGAFPGVSEILPGCTIVEAAAGPGEARQQDLEQMLPGCKAAIVNAQALVGHALPRILKLAGERKVNLIGPTTPLTERLFDYGVAALAGLVVTDADGLALAVANGATAREFGRFGKYINFSERMSDWIVYE